MEDFKNHKAQSELKVVTETISNDWISNIDNVAGNLDHFEHNLENAIGEVQIIREKTESNEYSYAVNTTLNDTFRKEKGLDWNTAQLEFLNTQYGLFLNVSIEDIEGKVGAILSRKYLLHQIEERITINELSQLKNPTAKEDIKNAFEISSNFLSDFNKEGINNEKIMQISKDALIDIAINKFSV